MLLDKNVVDSKVISKSDIDNLVSSKKIHGMQTCYSENCETTVYISDKIYNDYTSPFFVEDVLTKTVMSVWGLCNSKVLRTTVHGENIVVVVLRVNDSNKNQYVAIAMFESEFNS